MEISEKLKPISRVTLADEIFNQVLELIINRELSPGEKLPSERDLSDKLGVGRSSVREALRALATIGLLDTRPGEGTFVTKSPTLFFLSPFILREHITKENVSKIMEARLVLEVKLAAFAAERGTKEEKDLIRQCFDNMIAAKDDYERCLMEDWRFHEAIAQAANNSYLFQMFLMTRHLVQEWMYKPPQEHIYDYIRPSWEEHRKILDSIQAGDVSAAGIAMQKHLENAIERLLKVLALPPVNS